MQAVQHADAAAAALRVAQDQVGAAAEANAISRQALAVARQGVKAANYGAAANFLLALTPASVLLWQRFFPPNRPRLSIGYSVISEGPETGHARITNMSSVPFVLEHWELMWMARSGLFWKATGMIEMNEDFDASPKALRLGESQFFPLDIRSGSKGTRERLDRGEVVGLMLYAAGQRRPLTIGVWPDRVNQRRLWNRGA